MKYIWIIKLKLKDEFRGMGLVLELQYGKNNWSTLLLKKY
jgi:hypothetical protein